MKNLLLIVSAFILLTAFCDDKIKGNGKITTQSRTLQSFSSISVGGSMDITIDQNGKENADVETDENLQDLVITEVKDHSLNIHLKENSKVSYTKMIIHVSCKTLNEISSGGSGDCKSVSTIKNDALKIAHGGSGNFDLNTEVKELSISSGGSGDFKLKGEATSLNISAAGSGDINAQELSCTSAKISMAGSGDVKLKKGVKASVSSVGSGEVSYE